MQIYKTIAGQYPSTDFPAPRAMVTSSNLPLPSHSPSSTTSFPLQYLLTILILFVSTQINALYPEGGDVFQYRSKPSTYPSPPSSSWQAIFPNPSPSLIPFPNTPRQQFQAHPTPTADNPPPPSPPPTQWDFAIAGAGTSGCALVSPLCKLLPQYSFILTEKGRALSTDNQLLRRIPRRAFDTWH